VTPARQDKPDRRKATIPVVISRQILHRISHLISHGGNRRRAKKIDIFGKRTGSIAKRLIALASLPSGI